ncbi:MAG: hypothetical protein QXN95_05320 [Candidatus Bathyarchaeia archaeon]
MSFLKTIGKVASSILPFGSVISNAMNARSQRKINEQNIRYAREAYNRERQDSLADWHMQNAYNDPSQQMARLQNAGLNPNLVYGHGADAQMAAPVKPTKQQLPDLKAIDYGGIVPNAIGTLQAMANIKRTEAETNRINQDTIYKEFENKVKQGVGIDQHVEARSRTLDKDIISGERAGLEYEAWKYVNMYQKGVPMDSPDNPTVKKLLADYDLATQKVNIAKEDLNIKQAIKVVKDFEADMARAGISPNSPWYVKIVEALISNITGVSITDMVKSLYK